MPRTAPLIIATADIPIFRDARSACKHLEIDAIRSIQGPFCKNARSSPACVVASVKKLRCVPEFVTRLIPLLADSDGVVRRQALDALGQLGVDATPAVAAIITLLGDPLEFVRRQAAFARGQMGSAARDATPALIEAQQDPEPGVRFEAMHALERLAATTSPTAAEGGGRY